MKKYGVWAGNPEGRDEDITKCIVEIYSACVFHQCQRKRGYGKDGLYCKQHAKMLEQRIPLFIPKEAKE